MFGRSIEAEFKDSFSTDKGCELIFAELVDSDHVFFFRKKLMLLKRSQTFGHDVVFEVQDALDILERHVQQRADTAWQRLQKPDVSNRRCEFDVTHALATNARERDFHAALFADNALVFHTLVLAAQAFIILDRAKDTRAEETIAFRLERTIVDRLRLLDLAV